MFSSGNFVVDLIVIVIIVGSYLIGKYVTPNLPEDTKKAIAAAVSELTFMANFADKLVIWARDFLKDSKGSEKMNEVLKQLEELADKYNIDMTKEQLTAIAQTAYNNMMAKDAAAKTDAAAVATEAIKAIVIEKPVAVGEVLTDPNVGTVAMLDDNTKVIKE